MCNIWIRIATGIISGALFLATYAFSSCLFSLVLFGIFLYILAFEWPMLCIRSKKLWLLVPFYPLIPTLCLIYLNHAYRAINILLPLYPFFISWAADTGGYVFGKLAGRHKILPAISPKKSWEGLGGSILAVFLVLWIVIVRSFGFALIPYAVMFALVAFAGDLFESFLKRRAGVKDTGVLLPGHGGLLDRFDSVFFVGVVFLPAIKFFY